MKKVIKFLPAMAILIGSGLALATVPAEQDGLLYPKVNGQWQSSPINPDSQGQPGGWDCEGDTDTCTGRFTTPPAPNAADPAVRTNGTFIHL